VHTCAGDLEQKLGCGIMLRASQKEWALVPFLVESKSVLQLTNDNLQHLLQYLNMPCPKSTTKAWKIRRIMMHETVKGACSADILAEIEQKLVDEENMRKKRKRSDPENDENEAIDHDAEARSLFLVPLSSVYKF
jgi:hypothetical protein